MCDLERNEIKASQQGVCVKRQWPAGTPRPEQ
jgi:hypothetical protein